MIQMSPESEAFLNALVPAEGAVTTDHTDAIYALMEPLHDVLDKVEAHLQEIDRLRRKADAAEENPVVYGWFERFKQAIDAARRKNAEAKRAWEEITEVCYSLDTYAREMRETITRKSLPPEDNGRRILLTDVEHQHLTGAIAALTEQVTKLAKENEQLKGSA